MMERPFRRAFGEMDGDDRQTEVEKAELAAFFRELGLGWEVDPEGLIDRLADPRSGR